MFLLTFGVSARADRATFEIKLPDELPQKGDTFEVSIEISDNPGFCALEFVLTYDKKIMVCEDMSLKGILKNAMGVTNPEAADGAKLGAVSLDLLEGDGTITEFIFVAKEDITEFDFELEDLVLADSDLNDIDYKVSGGKTEEKEPPVFEDETDTEDKETNESETVPEEDKSSGDKSEVDSNKESEDEPLDKDSDDKTTDKEQIDDSEDAEDKITDKEESDSDSSKDKTDDKNSDEESSDKDDDTDSGKETSDKKDDVASNDKDSSDKSETKPTPDDKEKDPVREYNFPDVVGHWSEQYVINAAKLGLFIGDTDGNFRPDDNVTRAQFVTVLWRMAGKEHVDIKTPFKDIENELPEFIEAINWAYAKGYINGISETEFAPSSPITREAGMKILHFYSGGKIGMEIQLYPIYDGILKDSKEISSWAKPSVYWGIYNKMISGMTEDTMLPKGNATRAQLAKILVNYLEID